MSMQQALRQMPARAGRAAVTHGEAVSEPGSDEACGPRRATEGTGSADLNFSNRPVRTRMPGGVGGAQPIMAAPYPDEA